MTGVPNAPGGVSDNARDMRQAIDGATIRVQIELPNGSWLDMSGAIQTSDSVDCTPSGLAENALQHRRTMPGAVGCSGATR